MSFAYVPPEEVTVLVTYLALQAIFVLSLMYLGLMVFLIISALHGGVEVDTISEHDALVEVAKKTSPIN